MAKKPDKKVRRRNRKSKPGHAKRAQNRTSQLEGGGDAWARFFARGADVGRSISTRPGPHDPPASNEPLDSGAP